MNNPSSSNNPDPTYPLAYTEGHTWFYGRKFLTTPAALIPRPETEGIIDIVKAIAGDHLQSPLLHILDIGTGTGIIAITLSLELPEAQITATDISKEALALARQNANLHKASPTFLHSNLFSNLGSDPKKEKHDIICANLPYVDPTWPWLDKKALSHEPPSAIFAEDQGLFLIKKLILQTPPHLTPGGTLILEHDPSQYKTLSTFALEQSFTPTQITPYITTLTPTLLAQKRK